MTEESVKVAVRVRPFNKREKAMSAELIVEMKGSSTTLREPDNPNAEPRKFTFDYSYWSFDGSKERADGYFEAASASSNYCDQKKVYDDVGAGVLANAWEGYNSTLFAYGQTGSGKSWSVVGYGINKGIVPQFCENLYKEIDARKGGEGDKNVEYEVTFSMLEIYNERCRDLLKTGKESLKIRQHPKKGFYAEGLTYAAVGSFEEIERRMEEGTTNRTVASTNMNATSSRAHTVVGISFVQKFQNAAGEGTTKSAIVNLVDLAGSERAESTGATGDRLKEGAAINQSLSALGNCIAALADRSQGKNVRVPFRDSVLTKLLKNALGGNSKTVMIAAISPADVNYEETLSTLRYADRAKQIKTKVSVNEDPTEKLIRELQEENDRLKAMLESGAVALPQGTGENGIEAEEGMSAEEVEELKKQLREEMEAEMKQNLLEMEEMNKTFQEKMNASANTELADQLAKKNEKKSSVPHITNLNYDPQLSGRILHFVEEGALTIGNGREEGVRAVLKGPSILPQHASIEESEGKVVLTVSAENAVVIVNGEPVQSPVTLTNGDRVVFGTSQYYVFVDPRPDKGGTDPSQVTFEMAQEELSKANVMSEDAEGAKPDRQKLALQGDVASLLPAIQEANAIAEELQKQRKFELILTPPEGRGDLQSDAMQVFVKMTELDTGMVWTWDQRTFLARKFKMQDMFNKFEDGEEWKLPENQDPFIMEPSAPVHIGSVRVWLIGLAHYVETYGDKAFTVYDYYGNIVGNLEVDLQPCDATGRPLTYEESLEVDEPHEMLNKDIHFVVSIKAGRDLPARYTDLCCRYRLLQTDPFTETKIATKPVTPVWDHKKQFSFCPMTHEVLQQLSTGAMSIELWGRQVREPSAKPVPGQPILCRQSMMQMAQGLAGELAKASQIVRESPESTKAKFEVVFLRKKLAKLEQRMKWMQRAVDVADERKVRRVPVDCIKGLLSAQSDNKAEGCYALIVKEEDSDSSDSEDSKSAKSSKSSLRSPRKQKEPKEKKVKSRSPSPTNSTTPESCACIML